jgi:hypothetical protein
MIGPAATPCATTDTITTSPAAAHTSSAAGNAARLVAYAR